jgi:hypothetical protein
MPCYDGHREDERRDRESARKVEAALCAMIGTFGFENLGGVRSGRGPHDPARRSLLPGSAGMTGFHTGILTARLS